MESWLSLVRWYAACALSPDVTLDQLINEAPVITTTWATPTKIESLVRWGRVWKCYDLCRSFQGVGILFCLPMKLSFLLVAWSEDAGIECFLCVLGVLNSLGHTRVWSCGLRVIQSHRQRLAAERAISSFKAEGNGRNKPELWDYFPVVVVNYGLLTVVVVYGLLT